MLRRFSLLVAVAWLLSGCGGPKLAYSQLDWLVPAYLESYVDLDGTQRARLDSLVSDLLDWHCASQLHEYAGWLRKVGTDFQAQGVSYRRLEDHYLRLQGYLRAIAEQATPRLSELLQSISDEQLDELFASLSEKNEDFRQDYIDKPLPRVQKKYARQMGKRLKRWLGELTPEQQRDIAQWSQQIDQVSATRLRMRLSWQSALQQALRARANPDFLEAQVHALFVHPERFWSDDDWKRLTAYHHSVLQLIGEISATLTAQQRAHLRARTNHWADDLDALACGDKTDGKGYAKQGRDPQSKS